MKNSLFLLMLIGIFSSCGTTFNNSRFTAPENGLVAMSGKIIAQDGEGTQPFKYAKNQPKQLEVQRPGHKTLYTVWYASRPNVVGLTYALITPAAVGILAAAGAEDPYLGLATWPITFSGLIDLINTPRMVEKRNVAFQLTELPRFSEIKSSVSFERFYLDTAEIEITKSWYKSPKKLIKKLAYDSIHYDYFSSFGEGWGVDRMNAYCYKLGLIDTNELNLSKYQDLAVYATLKDYDFRSAKVDKSHTVKTLSMDIHYKVLNECGKAILDKTVTSNSGLFLADYPNDYLFQDALDYNLGLLFKEDVMVKAIENDPSCDHPTLPIEITANTNADIDYEEWSKQCLKVETPFGSGIAIPVGKDGIVAMSHRVLDLTTELAFTHQGSEKKYTGEVIAESLQKDYAFVQIDSTFEKVFNVAQTPSDIATIRPKAKAVGYAHGVNVFSQVNGKVNVIRSEHDYPLYQLDIDANLLYYPAIFNDQNELIGFVATSLKSYNVEGISFFRPIRL